MINRIWSTLNRGLTPTSPYSRKLSAGYSSTQPNQRVLDVLVPPSLPVLEYHFRIERLVQALLRSVLRERALAFDPVNTYEKVTLGYPEPGFATSAVYPAFFGGGVTEGLSFTAECILNPAGTFTVDGETQTFTITDGLTSVLTLPQSKTVRFRDIAVGDVFQISFIPQLTAPLPWLVQRLESVEIVWPDAALRQIWQQDWYWLNRLSAAVLAVAEAAT
jgi:hypothetical protein